MRFKTQCLECGAYKWCGRDCDRKPISRRDPQPWIVYADPEYERPRNLKFDRKAYMRERWAKKRMTHERD
jgi:hypothetical protein